MLFGSINYLNLLPFRVYLKRHTNIKLFKSGVPSKVNELFQRKKVNAAVVSSIVSKKYRCTDLGIIAEKKVYSVLLLPGENAKDPASETSNALAHILDLQGKVLIGDAALKHYLNTKEGIDLAEEWYKKTGLPFVFARLCFHKDETYLTRLASNFTKTKVRIPQYILKKEGKKRGIAPKEILWYLDHIKYQMNHKSKRSLKLFLGK